MRGLSVIASAAKQSIFPCVVTWIASSQVLLAMTIELVDICIRQDSFAHITGISGLDPVIHVLPYFAEREKKVDGRVIWLEDALRAFARP